MKPIDIHEETKLALELVMKERHHIFTYDDAIAFLLKLDGKRMPHNSGKIPEPTRCCLGDKWIESEE